MHQTRQSYPDFEDRIRGLLLGVAFGDAIGAPVERLTFQEIKERYGRAESLDIEWHRADATGIGPGGRRRGGGIVTDDTLMTLSLIRVYARLKRHLDAWDMATELVREVCWTPIWIAELNREAMLVERLFYPDKMIYLRLQLAACDPRQGGIGNMVNCGAAMYCAPIGAANACDPRAAYEEAIAFASGHQQSYGLEAAGAIAAAVASAFVPGQTSESVVNDIVPLLHDGTRDAIEEISEIAARKRQAGAGYDETTLAFHEAIAKYSSVGDDLIHTAEKAGQRTNNYQPSRFGSIEELPIALGYCVYNDGAFEKSVLDGVNSGRDTDSIGSMAGAVLGAMYGTADIPSGTMARIEGANKFELASVADSFSRTLREIFEADAQEIALRKQNRRDMLRNSMTPNATAMAGETD